MRKIFTIFLYIFAAIGLVMTVGYIALQTGLTKTKGIVDTQHDYFQNVIKDDTWAKTEEWSVLKEAIIKDKDSIDKASKATGIPSRIIVSCLIVEQLRLFYSNRELFKQVFAPLKILGNQSQFSWGVMGIKQETAREIEQHLAPQDTKLLAFTTNTPDNERFERLTNENDRYYSYLYAALNIKEFEKQWKDAGFPIENNAGVIATLYNIGFENSKPHASPLSGGAEIEINKTTYSFGGFAQVFYDSGELVEEFGK